MSQHYVCPASLSGSLDNFLRRLVHKPEKILSPFIREGMVVLDMGCGPGYFTLEIAKLVGESGKVIAADLQPEMLEIMNRKIRKNGLDMRVEPHLCQSDSTNIKKRVDFILTFWMVHEVPDQKKFFDELRSLLNPGGMILIAEPKFHVTKSSFSAMISRLESAGLRITEQPHIAISRSLVLTGATL
jgi:ubiquinone/menaquinone biosynthesis C-methylase UbiE